jgi:hypothetical protein
MEPRRSEPDHAPNRNQLSADITVRSHPSSIEMSPPSLVQLMPVGLRGAPGQRAVSLVAAVDPTRDLANAPTLVLSMEERRAKEIQRRPDSVLLPLALSTETGEPGPNTPNAASLAVKEASQLAFESAITQHQALEEITALEHPLKPSPALKAHAQSTVTGEHGAHGQNPLQHVATTSSSDEQETVTAQRHLTTENLARVNHPRQDRLFFPRALLTENGHLGPAGLSAAPRADLEELLNV